MRAGAGTPGARDITRTLPFWLIFTASTLGGITNSASTPIIPSYVQDVLGGGTTLAGVVIAIAAVASMIAQPTAGALADRRGYRTVAVTGGLIAVIGMSLLALVPTLWGAGLSRILFGLGNSAAMGIVMAWLVAIAPAAQRGKALSYFGLSVWIGLAVGPQVGTAVDAVGGPTWVFAVCTVLEAATVATILALPRPKAPAVGTATGAIALPQGGGRQAVAALRSVWTAGVVAAAAWSGEGLMIAFLIVHLGAAGVPAVGIGGAATVYAVFAVSVVGARLLLARLPDRIGPLRATALSLSALALGMTVLALSRDFWVASLGAVLIGVGFSPLYPSLTMIATRGLTSQNRAFGLGLFASFTSIGYGGGALLGGAVIAAASSTLAFLIVAGLQLVALAVLVGFSRDDTPRVRTGRDEPRDPAA